MFTTTYPATFEKTSDSRVLVRFPDFGWGVTDGADREEAFSEAQDCLRTNRNPHDEWGKSARAFKVRARTKACTRSLGTSP